MKLELTPASYQAATILGTIKQAILSVSNCNLNDFLIIHTYLIRRNQKDVLGRLSLRTTAASLWTAAAQVLCYRESHREPARLIQTDSEALNTEGVLFLQN